VNSRPATTGLAVPENTTDPPVRTMLMLTVSAAAGAAAGIRSGAAERAGAAPASESPAASAAARASGTIRVVRMRG
jgi:hypothetical protein